MYIYIYIYIYIYFHNKKFSTKCNKFEDKAWC